jgi:hypothetical protein
MKYPTLAAVAFALAHVTSAFADNGLYEDVVDPSSSFVRVVAPGQTVVSIDGNTVRDIEGGVSRYVNVMPGDIDVVLPNGNVEMAVSASTHYTLIMTVAGETSIIIDNIANSPAKADVSLYNLSMTDGVDLYVPAANTVAIDDLAPLQSQTIAVRAPLTLDLEVRSGEEILSSVSQVELERGAGVSIVLIATDEGYSAVAVPNSYLN